MRTLFALATVFFVSTSGLYQDLVNGNCQPGFKEIPQINGDTACENWYVFVSFKVHSSTLDRTIRKHL